MRSFKIFDYSFCRSLILIMNAIVSKNILRLLMFLPGLIQFINLVLCIRSCPVVPSDPTNLRGL